MRIAIPALLALSLAGAAFSAEELEPSDPPAPAPAAEDTVEFPAAAAPAAPADSPARAADTAAISPAPQVQAAPQPGEDDIVIEVDKDQSRNKDKSLPLAMLYSALLPGAGELYLGEKGKAKAFLLVETGFWASLYVAYVAKESYFQSARNYASQHAGIDASRKDEAFLETMANFRAYQEKQHRQDSYELAQILSGKREQDYEIKPAEENYWDFGSSANPENTSNWQTFQATLRYYRASKVAMSFAIGALALNRLASLVNTLADYKRTSASGLSLGVTPELGSDHAGASLTLRF